jgi:hypothetical protein
MRSKRTIPKGETLMPPAQASAGVKLARMHIALALTLAPALFGSMAVYLLARSHLISYWWLALTLGSAIIPLVIFVRSLRYARQVAQPSQSSPLAQRN